MATPAKGKVVPGRCFYSGHIKIELIIIRVEILYSLIGSLDLKTVRNELNQVERKTVPIGIQLGMKHHKVLKFKDVDDFLSAILNEWLCGNVEGVPVTWEFLVEALKSPHVDEGGLARQIAAKYCCEQEQSPKEKGKPLTVITCKYAALASE